MNKGLGISLAVLGIALAVTPFFTDCASQGKFMTDSAGMPIQMTGNMGMLMPMPMSCYGNRAIELAIGGIILELGIAMAFVKLRSKAFFSISVIAILAGFLGSLMPTSVIGVCPHHLADCNLVMKPIIISLGSFTIMGGVLGVASSRILKIGRISRSPLNYPSTYNSRNPN
ncbi:MAG: DUF4418 family protein [Dehalococcoidales bacterium]|nr:DUF4418 family protein [Dehalococcoidales bacterium]